MNTRVAVVVGNPKPRSRTRAVAEQVARAAAQAAGLGDPSVEELHVIDLADLAGQLFDWSSTAVREQVEILSSATLAVVASPVYKASYTGLLKAFLDWFGQTGLDGVTVVPVMVGGSAAHALAVEVHLRPVLVEIGASLPSRGLFVLEQELDQLGGTIAAWLERAAPQLARSVRP